MPAEVKEFVAELDEDAMALQASIYDLQTQLKEAREALNGRNGKPCASSEAALNHSSSPPVSTTKLGPEVAVPSPTVSASTELPSVGENGASSEVGGTLEVDSSHADETTMQCD